MNDADLAKAATGSKRLLESAGLPVVDHYRFLSKQVAQALCGCGRSYLDTRYGDFLGDAALKGAKNPEHKAVRTGLQDKVSFIQHQTMR